HDNILWPPPADQGFPSSSLFDCFLLLSGQYVTQMLCLCFQSQPASLPAVDISTKSNGPKQESLFDEDTEDLFA
uniref:Uncharacterized protein n=1 Tax=Oryzias sinensis TaxID=183150 RepID=A0A8C7WW62_9TELE